MTPGRYIETQWAHMDLPDVPLFSQKLTERSELEISQAVQECARLCLEHPEPQRCIREFVAKLLGDGWSDDDAREVLTGAIGVVERLTKGQDAD